MLVHVRELFFGVVGGYGEIGRCVVRLFVSKPLDDGEAKG